MYKTIDCVKTYPWVGEARVPHTNGHMYHKVDIEQDVQNAEYSLKVLKNII